LKTAYQPVFAQLRDRGASQFLLCPAGVCEQIIAKTIEEKLPDPSIYVSEFGLSGQEIT